MRRVHFISGLPRSGSTLLAAILRQNPHFYSGITGPLAPLCEALHQRIGGTGEFAAMFDGERCAQMLRGLFDAYYASVDPDDVIFDTNRSWTGRAALLAALYPDCRIICCVRNIGWIIDSLERLRAKNPLQLSKLFTPRPGESIYTRVDDLMNSDTGLIGSAWSLLREAWFSEAAPRLVVVPYETLVKEPRRVLQRIYAAIDLPYYAHDFSNVAFDAPDYDSNLRTPGLHTVHRTVAPRERPPAIPPDLFVKYSKSHFWENPELNIHGATVL